MRQRDEEKRSKLWVIVLLGSTAIIILVALFFVLRGATRNPLEGEWVSKEQGYYMDVDDDGEVTLEGTFGDIYVDIDLYYTIDKKNKEVTLKEKPDSYQDALEDTKGAITGGELQEMIQPLLSSYNYSLENETLTLTEREYGEQIVFTRVNK